MEPKKLTRRELLRYGGLAASAGILAACAPKVVEVEKIVEKEVTKVIKEVVKETVIVAGTPQVVEREVTKVVKEVVTAAPAPKERVEISFEHFFMNPELWDFAFKPIFEYIEQEANVKIINISTPYNEMMPKLFTLIAAGTPPDLTSIDNEGMPGVAMRGAVLPLDERVAVDPPCPMDDIMPSRIADNTVKGILYGMPIDQGSDAVYYNKRIFDKAGVDYPTADWTWDDLLELALVLTVDKSGKNAKDPGFDPENIVQWGFQYTTGLHRVHNLVASLSGNEKWFDKEVTKCLMDAPEIVDAYQYLIDLRCKSHVAPTAEQLSGLQDAAAGLQVFSVGRYAMEFTWVGLCSHMLREGVGVKDWDVVYFPKGKKTTATSGGQGFPIVKGSKHPDEAWEVIKLFFTEKVMKLLGQGGAWMPARISYAHWGCAESGIPHHYVEAFVEPVAKYGFSKYWYVPGWVEWSRVINTAFEPCWLCQRTAQEAITEFLPEVNELVAKRERF